MITRIYNLIPDNQEWNEKVQFSTKRIKHFVQSTLLFT